MYLFNVFIKCVLVVRIYSRDSNEILRRADVQSGASQVILYKNIFP